MLPTPRYPLWRQRAHSPNPKLQHTVQYTSIISACKSSASLTACLKKKSIAIPKRAFLTFSSHTAQAAQPGYCLKRTTPLELWHRHRVFLIETFTPCFHKWYHPDYLIFTSAAPILKHALQDHLVQSCIDRPQTKKKSCYAYPM